MIEEVGKFIAQLGLASNELVLSSGLQNMGEIAVLDRTALVRQGQRLEYFAVIWNAVEGLVAVVAGLIAGSISLVGFGIDSFIEVTSGSVLLWRMSVDANVRDRERNEKRALRIVGLCFSLLAVYIGFESGSDLWFRRAPEHSIPGIMLACLSLVVMPLLSRSKRTVGMRSIVPRCRRTRNRRSFARIFPRFFSSDWS